MRKILLSFLFFAVPAAFAQNGSIQGFCSQGGVPAKTQGMSSTNRLQGIVPSCTVTVYLTGTLTKATVYSNIGGSPLANPFTATAVSSSTPGSWLFYAAMGQGLDVVASGGIAPNTYPAPVTLLVDAFPGGGGGSGSGCGISGPCTIGQGGTDATTAPAALANLAPGISSPGAGGLQGYSGSGSPDPAWTIYPNGTANFTAYQVSGIPFGTINLSDWTNSGVVNGDCAVWNSFTTKWTPGVCGGGVTWPTENDLVISAGGTTNPNGLAPVNGDCVVGAGGNWTAGSCGSYTLPIATTSVLGGVKPDGTSCTVNPSTGVLSCSGSGGGYPGVTTDGADGLLIEGAVSPGTAPYCDIRSQGYVPGTSPLIDPYFQKCLNVLAAAAPGTAGLIRVEGGMWNYPSPCQGANCSLSTPIGYAASGPFNLLIDGTVYPNSTMAFGNGVSNIAGAPGVQGTQYQRKWGPLIQGSYHMPYGTLGSAITTTNAAVTLTLTYTNSSILYQPPGSAITIAGTNTVTGVTASRVNSIYGAGLTTLTFPSAQRVPSGTVLTVTGCADSSFDISNGAVSFGLGDLPPTQAAYYQTSTTVASTTGCTATVFNDDSFESARIICSNGVVLSGFTASCSTGQVTFWTKFTHAATDQWGTVVAGPAVNTYSGQTWENLTFQSCNGACLWFEGDQFETVNNVGVYSSGVITSVPIQLSESGFNMLIHWSVFNDSDLGAWCPGGGCPNVSYPQALKCDADPNGFEYGSGNNGCNYLVVDGQTSFHGGIKTDASGMPQIKDKALFEEVATAGLMVDNRIAGNGCGYLDGLMQDTILNSPIYDVAYTDSLQATGCMHVSVTTAGSNVANPYFLGQLIVEGPESDDGITASQPVNNSGPSALFLGNPMQAENMGSGANFGPSILPYGSLAMDVSTADWASSCTSSGQCTATDVVAPDGPSGKMQAAELAATGGGCGGVQAGEYTGTLYAGDVFLYGAWVRPGTNQTFSGCNGTNNSVQLYIGSGAFANQASPTVAQPTAFGTALANTGWYPQVATVTVATGSSGSTYAALHLFAPGTAGWGNQFSQPFMAFIPGPNNPACTAAGTCNLTPDRIEEARRDQYHSMVVPNMPAGVAATGEAIEVGYPSKAANSSGTEEGICLADGTNCPSGSGTVSDGSGTTTTGELAQSTSTAHVISYSATPSLGTAGSVLGALYLANGSGGGSTTELESAATSPNVIKFPATVLGNGDLMYCVVFGSGCTLTDTGYAFNAIPAADIAVGSLASGMTATTQAAGDNSTKLQTTAGSNVVYGYKATSGSSYSMSALTGMYWEASTGAFAWDLPTPPALPSTVQFCFGKSGSDEYVISIIPPSGVTIYFGGAAGTAGSSTGLVSPGTQADYICLVSVGAAEYQAIGPGVGGTWVNH